MKEVLSRLYQGVGTAELFLAKIGVLTFTLLIFLSAVARTMGSPQGWAQDWAIFVFVWCVFFSADVCWRQDKLVTVDILTSHLSPRVNSYLKLFNLLAICAFLVFLVYYGVSLTYTSRFVRFQGLPYFSYSWVAVSLPLGSLLMLVTSAVKVAQQLKSMRAVAKLGVK